MSYRPPVARFLTQHPERLLGELGLSVAAIHATFGIYHDEGDVDNA